MASRSISTPRTQSQSAQTGIGLERTGDRHRLFFALLPDAGVRKQILHIAESLKIERQPLGRWIAPEHYHVTLRYLGEDLELRPDFVARAIAAAKTVRVAAFDLRIDQAASFTGTRPPWVLRGAGPALAVHALWQTLGDALIDENVRCQSGPEFSPHVTVLRDADKPLAALAIEPIVWPAREFVLIHSHAGRERRYSELGRWPLAGATRPQS
jgi:2'-5' RNA ligase